MISPRVRDGKPTEQRVVLHGKADDSSLLWISPHRICELILFHPSGSSGACLAHPCLPTYPPLVLGQVKA